MKIKLPLIYFRQICEVTTFRVLYSSGYNYLIRGCCTVVISAGKESSLIIEAGEIKESNSLRRT